jgi:hypothetical protein
MPDRTLTYPVWDSQVDNNHPDAKERKIRQDGLRDWRDADEVFVFDGLRVRTEDKVFESRGGSVEPRWDEFDTFLMDDNGRVKMNLGRNPAPIFKDALLNGRVLYGCLISRDEQAHN